MSTAGMTTFTSQPASHSEPVAETQVQAQQPTNAPRAPSPPPTPEVDIIINNVVCSFSVKCHLNLRQIALEGVNVEYRRENGVSVNICIVSNVCFSFFKKNHGVTKKIIFKKE